MAKKKNQEPAVQATDAPPAPQVRFALSLDILNTTTAQLAAALMVLGISVDEATYSRQPEAVKQLFAQVQ